MDDNQVAMLLENLNENFNALAEGQQFILKKLEKHEVKFENIDKKLILMETGLRKEIREVKTEVRNLGEKLTDNEKRIKRVEKKAS